MSRSLKKFGEAYKILDSWEYSIDNILVQMVRWKYLKKTDRTKFKRDMKKVFRNLNDIYLELAKKK
jgi:hypothetical protein